MRQAGKRSYYSFTTVEAAVNSYLNNYGGTHCRKGGASQHTLFMVFWREVLLMHEMAAEASVMSFEGMGLFSQWLPTLVVLQCILAIVAHI
jgi:hypothetical protein